MEKSLLKSPLFEFDEEFKQKRKTPLGIELETFSHILGTDEAGRGPAAGGVWAACVCFCDYSVQEKFSKLND